MRSFKLMASIFFIFFLIFLAIGLWPDRNRAGIFGSRGFIDSGQKFGVEIGQNQQVAIDNLRSANFTKGDNSYTRQYSKSGVETCHGKEFTDEHTIDLFLDRSWRRGNICLASLDGKVVHVSWNYGMLQP